jgi:hypothetical protein
VDATVHDALGEIVLELASEQPLSADRAERLVEFFVAGCTVGLELRRDTPLRQCFLHLSRLSDRELRRARRDEQGPIGAWRGGHDDASCEK